MINYPSEFLDFFVRDLHALQHELNAYKDESVIWSVTPGISNSSGNLTLHLIGNLNHFFGAQLGATGYVRHRDAEFATKGTPRAELVDGIDQTITMLQETFAKMDASSLEQHFPLKIQDKEVTTGHFVIHLFGHLAYHLGQVNYHRRMLDK